MVKKSTAKVKRSDQILNSINKLSEKIIDIIEKNPEDTTMIQWISNMVSQITKMLDQFVAPGVFDNTEFDVDLALALSRIVHEECKEHIPHDIGIRLAQYVKEHTKEEE